MADVGDDSDYREPVVVVELEFSVRIEPQWTAGGILLDDFSAERVPIVEEMRASPRLTMATRGAPSQSLSVRSRPSSRGMRRALK
jgi:hypothetical protein